MIVYEKCVDKPADVPVAKMSDRKRKKFLIVNNHVREIPIIYNANSNEEHSEQSICENVEKRVKHKAQKKLRNKKIKDSTSEDTKISESDLKELRTVYENCKAVIKKIEMKYGHLLELDDEANSSTQRKRKTDNEIEECHCKKNKKIVFDEDGQEIPVDTTENHICHKKIKETPKHKNIEIQYTDNEIPLPDNIQELSKLLQNPDLDNTFRHRVNYKIKSMKDEVLNEIKFNKHSLIEQLKNNPDDILNFKGTNLASILGYL